MAFRDLDIFYDAAPRLGTNTQKGTPVYQVETAFWIKRDAFVLQRRLESPYDMTVAIDSGDDIPSTALGIRKIDRANLVHQRRSASPELDCPANRTLAHAEKAILAGDDHIPERKQRL